jgi:hypothetical protein
MGNAVTRTRKVVASTAGDFVEAAAQVAKQMAFPLILTLMVMIFLLVQYRLDRNDPKLAVAAITAAQETLGFT